MSSTPTTSNTDDSLSNEIDKIFTVVFNVDHSGTYRYEHNVMDFQDVYDAKKKLLQIIRQDREAREAAAVTEHWHKASTDNRPLSAQPLLVKQPVPCPRCGAEEYADWTLWPHQLYNSYMPGGVGHYCFPCFAAIVTERTAHPDSKAKA